MKIPAPRFTVHGTRGSFIRYGIDQQETSLKGGHYALGTQGLVKIVNARCWSISMTQDVLSEELPAVPGDYGRVYDALYDTLLRQDRYVSEHEALTNLDILQRHFNSNACHRFSSKRGVKMKRLELPGQRLFRGPITGDSLRDAISASAGRVVWPENCRAERPAVCRVTNANCCVFGADLLLLKDPFSAPH